jgi:hypothetical protein
MKKSPSQDIDNIDELIGLWENDLDDGSGLHAIWGWSFRFNEDGSGLYSSWQNQKLDDETPFSWSRINSSAIKVKYEDDEEWTIIEYSLKIIDAPYSGKLIKLTDNNHVKTDLSEEGFWGCFGAIYKVI